MSDLDTHIVRAPRREQFTIIPNSLLQRTDLSRRAKGLLCELLSRPEGWRTSAARLADQGPEGRDAMRATLKELEAVGYVVTNRWRDATTQQWRSMMTVFDEPPAPEPVLKTRTGSDQGEQSPAEDNRRSEPVRVSSDGFPATGSQALLERTEERTEEGGASAPTPPLDSLEDLEPPIRCEAHASGDPGRPCRPCGEQRKRHEAWLEGSASRRARAEREHSERLLRELRTGSGSPRSGEWAARIKADLEARRVGREEAACDPHDAMAH